MRTVLLASLRTHTRRYVAAAVAVVIGVAFIVVTDAPVLGHAQRPASPASTQPYRGADVVVSDVDGEDAARARRRRPRSAATTPRRSAGRIQPVREGDRLLDERADVGALAPDPALRWQELREGRFPDAAGRGAGRRERRQGRPDRGRRPAAGRARDPRAVDVTVVGLVDTPSAMVRGRLYLPWPTAERWSSSFYVDSVAYAGAGTSATSIERLEDETGATVQTADAYVEEVQTEITNEVNVIAMVLLVFAAIALFVSVLVIANTFSILFAQRSRDFALLRCVGATRRQVLRSIRLEALCLGVVASLLGLRRRHRSRLRAGRAGPVG